VRRGIGKKKDCCCCWSGFRARSNCRWHPRVSKYTKFIAGGDGTGSSSSSSPPSKLCSEVGLSASCLKRRKKSLHALPKLKLAYRSRSSPFVDLLYPVVGTPVCQFRVQKERHGDKGTRYNFFKHKQATTENTK
jgi:hypothetical protein